MMTTTIAFAAVADTASPDNNDIAKALLAPDITIGDYSLNRDDLAKFYTARDFRPAWSFVNQDNLDAFTNFLTSLDQLITWHGLQRDDYPIDLMQQLIKQTDDPSKLKLELLVTDSLVRLAHDLHGDGIDLNTIYPGWSFHRSDLDIPTELSTAVASNRINEFMESISPQYDDYDDLAVALSHYRDLQSKGGWAKIDPGPTLKPNDKGPRISQLRARLAIEDYVPSVAPAENGDLFDSDLHKALQEYQMRNGLEPDGNLGGKTLEALNIPVTTRIDQISANMERWRHTPDELPDRYAMVNIADASIDVIENENLIYTSAVIVGRVDRKTPFIQSIIRSMIVNPSWHVPAKIAQKDILPKLRRDPHYLEKLGFTISDSEDDPHGDNIDWASMPDREFNFHLRQSPGDMNSLGRLKFDFDNDFSVYLHGTPHKELFKKFERTLSSGCVRLQSPQTFAEVVLSSNEGNWNVKHIEDEIAKNKTHWVAVAKPLPLYILYWTVFMDEDGQINFRRDVYDYDRFLIENLQGQDTDKPSSDSTKDILSH